MWIYHMDSNELILSINYYMDQLTYAYSCLNGKVKIKSSLSTYSLMINKPIQKVIFQPRNDAYLTIAMATLGAGVLLVDANNMRLKK